MYEMEMGMWMWKIPYMNVHIRKKHDGIFPILTTIQTIYMTLTMTSCKAERIFLKLPTL